jgi:tRNA A-37 threonylcarbamoyl transferase component Bud32
VGVRETAAAWAQPAAVRAYRYVRNHLRPLTLARELEAWKARRHDVIQAGRLRSGFHLEALRLNATQRRAVGDEVARDGLAVIATIDQDGYWESRIGPIDGVPTFVEGGFLRRNKFDIDVVSTPAYVGVRKRYRRNHRAFLNELAALDRLGALGMQVPAILDADFDEPSLVVSYIPGRVLREALVCAGAPIRNRDRVPGRTRGESWQLALRAGRAALPGVVSQEFIAELARDLARFHDATVMVRDVKWGNIIIGDTGRPWWIDFHMAESYPGMSRGNFRVLADLDIEQFNQIFGTAYPTPTRPFRPIGPA